ADTFKRTTAYVRCALEHSGIKRLLCASAARRQNDELEVVAERAAQCVLVAGDLEQAAGLVGGGGGAAARGELEHDALAVEAPGALERRVVHGALAAGLDAEAKLAIAGRDEAHLGLVARRAGLLPLAAETHQPLVRRG